MNKYSCYACDWVGDESELAADYTFDSYSNCCCPICVAWDILKCPQQEESGKGE